MKHLSLRNSIPKTRIKNRYLFLILSFLFIGCTSNNDEPRIESGVLELSYHNFTKKPKIILSGKALFYWKQWPLDANKKFSKELLKTADTLEFKKILWTNIGKDRQGYGTYRFFIKREYIDKSLVLEIMRDTGSTEVYINGKLIETHGVPSKEASSEIANGQPLRFDLPDEKLLDIMFVISNHKHRMGGGYALKNSIQEKIYFEKNYNKRPLIEGVVTFLILLFGVYQILNFVSFPKLYYYLFFGLFCLFGASRQLFVGEAVIYSFFPDIHFSIIQKMRYVGYYGGLLAAFLYHIFLFPKYIPKAIIYSVSILCILGICFVMIAPVYEGTFSAPVFQYLGFFSILTGFYQIIKAIRDKQPFAIGMLINLCLGCSILVNDLLNAMVIIQSDYLMNYGVLMYVLFQIVINKKIQKQKEDELIKLSSDILELSTAIHKKDEELLELRSKSYRELKSKELLVENLKKVASNDDSISIKNLIMDLKSELIEESQLHLIKNDIEALNQEFFERIKELHPNLTKTDLEICSYLRISLGRKEIARLRFTSVDAVKKSRNRLRKKMNLSETDNLEHYLKAI